MLLVQNGAIFVLLCSSVLLNHLRLLYTHTGGCPAPLPAFPVIVGISERLKILLHEKHFDMTTFMVVG